ncbi:MAG TPA: hypothetical protein VHY08_07465 [Bacillota bacterium]|nr:hypothetical protein [Bacillota bacterium]
MKEKVEITSKYFIAPSSWTPDLLNPFSKDGNYGIEWSGFCLNKNLQSGYSIGKQGAGLFTLSVNPLFEGWQYRLGDFLQYEIDHGRKVILWNSEEWDYQIIIKEVIVHDFRGTTIRPYDERWVVHSTTLDFWGKIQESGYLKSLRRLINEGIEMIGIGLEPLGEPEDYIDYVMFDTLNGCSEIVVSSRQKGMICLDPNAPYFPGVRMYFDAHAIIHDGLIVRDGAHVLKVDDRLPLKPYLKMVLNESNVPYVNKERIWTPTLFTEAANKNFLEAVSS